MSDKIHDRVAEVLGMELADEDDEAISYSLTPDATTMVVPVPETAAEIDNPELPSMLAEMIRIEHGQQQTELLLNQGIATVQQALGDIALMPPVYKARAMETAAELFKAVADLSKYKVEVQIKLVEMKMKQAAFTRAKVAPTGLGTGNTFVINREELIRAFDKKHNANDDADDQS